MSLLVQLDFPVVTCVSDLIVTDKGKMNTVIQSDRKHERLLKFAEPLIPIWKHFCFFFFQALSYVRTHGEKQYEWKLERELVPEVAFLELLTNIPFYCCWELKEKEKKRKEKKKRRQKSQLEHCTVCFKVKSVLFLHQVRKAFIWQAADRLIILGHDEVKWEQNHWFDESQ